MQNVKKTDFFLGANSPDGFFSYYNELLDLETAEDLFILKGGPGCGKSSFMKRIASKLLSAGQPVEYIHCTSDPSSMDAVVFPDLKTAFVDGTAPHVIEPKYPIVVESYVNLGEFYDTAGVKSVRSEVVRLSSLKGAPYPRAYRLLNSAACVSSEIFNIVVSTPLIEKIRKRAKGIIEREIKKQSGPGLTKKRFLTGMSSDGVVQLFDTVKTSCEKVYLLSDSFGLSHFLLAPILRAAEASGHEAVACYCPTNPANRLEHIIIPGLSLAFVTSNSWHPYDGEYYRHIRLDAAVDHDLVRDNRAYTRSLQKISKELTDDAAASFLEAKKYHMELEALLNPFVDFDALYSLSDRFTERLMSKQANPDSHPRRA